MNKFSQKRATVRFRRWSRKAYAIFCSLGKCVTIGFLKCGIADASLGKRKSTIVHLSAISSSQPADRYGREQTDDLRPADDLLRTYLLAGVAQAAGTAHPYPYININIIEINRAGELRHAVRRLFYVFNKQTYLC